MSDVDDLLLAGLKKLPPKPADSASREAKKAYSESMSAVVAVALADALRKRNLRETMPASLDAEDVVTTPKGKSPQRRGPRSAAPNAEWLAAWARRKWT